MSDCYSVPQNECGSNYENSYGNCGGTHSKTSDACYNLIQSYQSHSGCFSTSYYESHHSCHSSGNVSVLTVALQDAANIGAGVQGDVGCSLDQYGQPQPPSL